MHKTMPKLAGGIAGRKAIYGTENESALFDEDGNDDDEIVLGMSNDAV